MKKTPLLLPLLFLLTGCLAPVSEVEEKDSEPAINQPTTPEDNNAGSENNNSSENTNDNQNNEDGDEITDPEDTPTDNPGEPDPTPVDPEPVIPDPVTPEPVDPTPVDPDPTPTNPETPEDDDDESGYLLDCGYYQMDLPKNSVPYELKTTLSADASSWSNNYMYDDLPTDFRFIYGNSCDDGPSGHRAQPKFYSYNEDNVKKYPGGLKFDQKSKGFQTQLFEHKGAKLEIRIGVTQVNEANDKPEVGKNPIGIYYFNKDGNYLGKHSIEVGDITKNTTEVKYYETSSFTSNIAYFEVRLNAMVYKGQQCYNIGIGYCNFKSWERI